MKFDYIIGNPPYQEVKAHGSKTTGNGDLWVRFTMKSIDMLENGGTLAYVIPDSVLSPSLDLMGSRISIFRDVFRNGNLKYVQTSLKNHFPKVGTSPCAFIFKNDGDYDYTSINGIRIDISNMPFIPKDDSKISLDIHRKIMKPTENEIKFKKRWTKNVTCLRYAEENKSSIRKYPVHDFVSYKPIRWSEHKDPDFDREKILVTYIGKYQCTADPGQMGAKPMVAVRFAQEGEILAGMHSFYDSELLHWIMNTNKWAQYLQHSILNYIPYPSFDRIYSNEDIYEFFGLNDEEVKYISQ